MNDDSVTRFLDAVEATGIVPDESMGTLRDTLAQAQAPSEQEVAAELVGRQLLTSYQAEQLLAGTGEELVLADRYQIREPLGAGAMGAVYLARDMQLDRSVAVKVLPEGRINDPEAVARFQREAKALAKLSHSAIVQAHDAGEDRGRHFLVMEYVRGTNLAALLKRKGPLSPVLAADFIYQAALGLEHAHDSGLVHRDLKPSNLLVTEKLQVKILDLGLARFLQDQVGDSTLTREGAGMGTPDYMAPEQYADAKNADARTDIYALGCTLYHLLTGRVPFPGSSLSEKREAHSRVEPQPIRELCPETPAGLTLVVGRMMAKRPADRFSTAREVAEALAPYVASSSDSLPDLNATASWHGGQLSLFGRRTRRRAAFWVAAGVALVAGVITLAVALPSLLHDDQLGEQAGLPGAQRSSSTAPRKVQPPADPNVLTVAQDGSGQLRTINEALGQVKPGMTIRVLDDATYSEVLSIRRPSQHAGLTLEAVQDATIENGVPDEATVDVVGVPRVTIRGFRLVSTAANGPHVALRGHCPGFVLDRVEMEVASGSFCNGVELHGVNLTETDSPVIVQNCTLRKLPISVGINGSPLPCSRIAVRNNTIIDPQRGILAIGSVKQIQIVGNRILGADISAIQLEHLGKGVQGVLIANNSMFEDFAAFRIWDEKLIEAEIELHNNLALGAQGPDMVFIDSGGSRDQPRGPGDGKSVPDFWNLTHNWRETTPPTGTDLFSQSWIPPSDQDVLKDQIAVLSRSPDTPEFLRPATDSPLATAGAGGDLPTYVGAVPPEGVEPWDWQETWEARHPKMLLTVSKDPEDGGEFRSIAEALKKATPGVTIRVLDEATYPEPLVIENPAQHEGIVLEAAKRATIALTAQSPRALDIQNVPKVTVKGFRFRESGAREYSAFVKVSLHSPGVVLEDLHIEQASSIVRGIVLQDVTISSNEEPLVIKKCAFDGMDKCDAAILVAGPVGDGPVIPTSGIAIRDNRVEGAARGIHIQGAVANTHVTGNLFWNCPQEGIGIQNLLAGSRRILLANNTVFGSEAGLRLWDDPPYEKFEPGQVELRNNLLLDASAGDVLFCRTPEGQSGNVPVFSVDGSFLLEIWRFDHNWRDLSGDAAYIRIPLASGDNELDKTNLISRDPSNPDFLRPAKDCPLATDGAGNDDPALPKYVGAVPPEGVEPWDWDKTWQSRTASPPDDPPSQVSPPE